VPRVHTVPGRHGSRLLGVLSDAARRHPRIDMLVPCRLLDLHPADRAVRAVVAHPDGEREEVTAAAALLATSGYGANDALVRRHLPDIAAATYHGGEHSTGDALRIGAGLGARTACLDAYQGHAGLSATARTLVTWTTVMHGGFLVNRDGRRFGDETSGYSEYASLLAGQPGATGWIVFDQRIHELSTTFVDYRDAVASGAVHLAETADDLAESISVPAGALRAELAEAAAVANGEKDDDRFGRSAFEAALTPPLRAVRVLPALFHTQGGLAVDEHARVLGQDGEPITGVYASGGAAVGISGRGASGYLGGNGLLPALGLAYLAASHAGRTSDGGEHR
ncbi:MAG: FAD-binding protein, partial [Pseudonocardia sp.]|nr:FAD-binding protein [Pseudonocardia sp.]